MNFKLLQKKVNYKTCIYNLTQYKIDKDKIECLQNFPQNKNIFVSRMWGKFFELLILVSL